MILRRLSIRWRLTLGSLLAAAVFFGLAAFAFYGQVATILADTTETLLQHDAAPIKSEISAGATTVVAPGYAQLVAVLDPQGAVVETTLPHDLAKHTASFLAFPDEPQPVRAGDDDYLVLTQHVSTAHGSWTVISARNLEASTLLLDRLTATLIFGAVAFTLGFALTSWMLTGAALRPVARMQRHASELSKTGSATTLPVGPAHDELSALAGTLNDFIVAQQHAVARERQMVSDASHELRSPLAVLRSQLELAHLRTGDAAALEKSIVEAERSLQRISTVATGLLDLAEVEAGHSAGKADWGELVAELGEAADRARLAGSRSNVTVDFDAEDTVRGQCESEQFPIAVSRFGRLIDNLTTNAINAMPEGGDLRMALRRSRGGLVLEIRDTGPGVPEDFIPVAFDRFTRPDKSRSPATGGSGLGLAIVKAIVQDAHGSVELSNHGGGGLVVRVRIPRSDEFER